MIAYTAKSMAELKRVTELLEELGVSYTWTPSDGFALTRIGTTKSSAGPASGGWRCIACGREWSAMCGDGEVPEHCPDCDGAVQERTGKA